MAAVQWFSGQWQSRLDILLHGASGYDRKIAQPLSQDPYLLFKLVVSRPNQHCTLDRARQNWLELEMVTSRHISR